jgi:hypothetical protein
MRGSGFRIPGGGIGASAMDVPSSWEASSRTRR